MQRTITPVKKIRILLVDDHAVMRMGLTTAANDASDMDVVADVENGHDAIEAYRRHRPDVVVLDLRLQGMGGVDTIRALREEFKAARILIFTNYAKGEEIYLALKAGAAGFVLKGMPLDRLLEAIRAVHQGSQYIPSEIATRIGERMLAQLSPREIEVLQLLARGLSNKEIAAQLGVVEGTVKIHITSIFSKLGVSDRTQALIEAIRRGIVQIE
ncbi:MAG: response regulator transcription factor [Opitutaceae bacterium]|nr:response regulator transcription factor [Opitutaceae bacterium]